ncbi:MAG: YcxB family protein [Candidatus Eisenbacteria bacterium]
MSEQSFSLTFDNLVDDHLAAERLYYRSTLFAKLDKVVAILLLLVGATSTWAVGARWWTVLFLPVAILEWFNLLTIRPLMIRHWFRKNPKFRETYHLAFDAGGVGFRTASIDSHVAWDHYTKVLEDDRSFLLVYGSGMYTVIPKRAFPNAAEAEEFRSLVGAWISAPAGRPSRSA